jgi:hypothetical protein
MQAYAVATSLMDLWTPIQNEIVGGSSLSIIAERPFDYELDEIDLKLGTTR